ncbi:hypothetical protein DL767_010450 [Monosporascus sp. MG133]|nr:hypothetical protein DL767_010450 [Monosporascus sp. MG133]
MEFPQFQAQHRPLADSQYPLAPPPQCSAAYHGSVDHGQHPSCLPGGGTSLAAPPVSHSPPAYTRLEGGPQCLPVQQPQSDFEFPAQESHATVATKRKAPRASLACDNCRQSKARLEHMHRPDLDRFEKQMARLDGIIEQLESAKQEQARACEIVQGAEDNGGLHEDPGSAAPPGKPAMPLDHTTHPIRWPAIRALTDGLLADEGIDLTTDFPIHKEQPVLRVFREGEMFGTVRQTPDNASKLTYPPLNGEAWGQAGGPSHSPQVSFVGRFVSADGKPDFDPKTVWYYTQSFKVNILNMHPIMVPEVLDRMVKAFLSSVSTISNTQSKANAGEKRKRPASEGSPAAAQSPSRPQRSITHAVVLLVLALGEICIHKGKAVPEADSLTRNSPSVGAGVLAAPLQDSPTGFSRQPQPCGLPSPMESEVATPRERSMHHLDVIPGQEYFALATDIIDGTVEDEDLGIQHAHGHILASLYHEHYGTSGLGGPRKEWLPSFYPDVENLEACCASSVLAVRLHAKFWDTQATLYRPFLRIILERDTSLLSSSMHGGHPPPRDLRATISLDAGSMNPSPDLGLWINEDAPFAIRTLVESAKAFLWIGHHQRIIFTNVFGAIHARFVDKAMLEDLFMKTIAFLGKIVTPTSALTAEMNILIGVANDLKFRIPGQPQPVH